MQSSGDANRKTVWQPLQVYVLAAVCFAVGLPVGYLFRGSAPDQAAPIEVADAQIPQPAAGKGMHSMPSLEDMKRMADKKADALIAKSKAEPGNAQLLNQIGIVYRSAHQFKEAETYFQKSLEINPKNADARTDLASCLYYEGDADGAITELEKALKADPKHAGALMNLGIIQWKGKNDAAAAVASWEKLLKLNPKFPKRQEVERLISEAKGGGKLQG
jgi:cytochrome c-type biogenesis protein CcmH/NrfG